MFSPKSILVPTDFSVFSDFALAAAVDIASHGRTGLVGHLMGSVTEKVVRASRCTVMVVRKP